MTPEELKERGRNYSKKYREKHREKIKKRRSIPEYKEAQKAWYKDWFKRNTKKFLNYQETYRKTAENRKRLSSAQLKRVRGLSYAERDIEIEKQGGVCAICKGPLPRPHIDHCHKTNRRRGILCQQCNHGLGNFKDKPELLYRAIQYLEEHMTKEKQETGLSVEDKLVVKNFETEAYKMQLGLQDAQQKVQAAIRQLNEFLKTLAEKYERDPKQYILNLETLEYVATKPPVDSK